MNRSPTQGNALSECCGGIVFILNNGTFFCSRCKREVPTPCR